MGVGFLKVVSCKQNVVSYSIETQTLWFVKTKRLDVHCYFKSLVKTQEPR